MSADKQPYLIAPNPADPRLTRSVVGRDQTGAKAEIRVVEERPLTIFLNSQEVVTAMTIGDWPDLLALGYLLNQNMLRRDDQVSAVDYDEELETVVVRTARETDYEQKMQKKIRTSGCAVGTVFGDVMEALDTVALPAAEARTSWLYRLAKTINTTPSLYLEAGRSMAACCAKGIARWSILKMSAGITRWIKLPAGCGARASRAATRSFTPPVG